MSGTGTLRIEHDRFGALEVVGFVDPELGVVESGADVVLFWELHNGGTAPTIRVIGP